METEFKDIELNDSLDLTIVDGDFVISESIQQEVLLIVNTEAGSWKQFPLCGLGIDKYLNSSGQQAKLRRDISVQLIADKQQIKKLSVGQDPADIQIATVRNG